MFVAKMSMLLTLYRPLSASYLRFSFSINEKDQKFEIIELDRISIDLNLIIIMITIIKTLFYERTHLTT